MEVNGIEAGRGAPRPDSIEKRPGGARKATPGQPRPAADDSVELSPEARRLSEGAAGKGRDARIEAARRRLESGELLRREVIEKAAENILRSGALDEADEA